MGAQLDITVAISVRGLRNGDSCGIRLRSSITDISQPIVQDEYTDVFIQFSDCTIPVGDTESECSSMTLNVDTTNSNSNSSIPVNRSNCYSGSVGYSSLLLDDHESSTVQLRAILDHSVVESFLGVGGERAVTRRVYPSVPESATNVQLFASCGDGNNVCECAFVSTNSWSMRNSVPSASPATDSSGNDHSNYIYYTVSGLIAGALFAFFGYRMFYMKRRDEEEPLMKEST